MDNKDIKNILNITIHQGNKNKKDKTYICLKFKIINYNYNNDSTMLNYLKGFLKSCARSTRKKKYLLREPMQGLI